MLCIKTMEWDINVKVRYIIKKHKVLFYEVDDNHALDGLCRSPHSLHYTLSLVNFSAIFLTSEARILKGGQALQGNANNSRHLLLDLGFDRSKLEHYRRLSTLGVPPDRVTPAGPDPHHHY
ncbi:hypothetical protein POTOM_058483 [Populus tomentosa]|uniref:Uncharacterized protein n=1 Tax=Populus tomentosa TaxID=118781 RepID=A0A8X8C2Y2_POPTO|nr:hypothetical protein POTOM_058483 [Populus tomentosa]